MVDDTARIRSDIEETREELGQTARALAGELNPRTRATRAAEDVRSQARARIERLLGAVREDPRLVAPLAGILIVVLLRRRRR
jgi:hypothetical protein